MGISHLLNQHRVIWYEKSNIKMKVNILALKKKNLCSSQWEKNRLFNQWYKKTGHQPEEN